MGLMVFEVRVLKQPDRFLSPVLTITTEKKGEIISPAQGAHFLLPGGNGHCMELGFPVKQEGGSRGEER